MPRFVIQEHHAKKLHYDFRLEMEGALKSWAVPKAPSKTPDLKRLAIQVEDHDIGYINFEGEIDEGLYGAGSVKIWDRGTYDIESKKGDKIVFFLHGKRLEGRYTLLRMKPRINPTLHLERFREAKWGKDQWLLFKTKKERREGAMKKIIYPVVLLLFFFIPQLAEGEVMKTISLSKPNTKGVMSVEEAIQKRRSVRSYAAKDISMEDVSQLLWACQGITDERRSLRAAPSAGALYPLEVYLVKRDGIFHYLPEAHKLEMVSAKDVMADLAQASHGQPFVAQTGIDIVICAVYERITSRYGERGVRYTHMEAGHAAQNVFLEAVALGLDSVPVGAFDDGAVSKILGLPKDVKPLYILPVGYRK